MTGLDWLFWATVLFLQNISFTYVSRARSSGSLGRHLRASVFSNGIWIVSQMIMLGPMFDYLTGKHGHELQLAAASLYTVSCVSGSLFAHWLAMKTEKGKDAVGYNKKYAQIPTEHWAEIQQRLLALEDVTAKKESPKVPGDNMNAGTFKIVDIVDPNRKTGFSLWNDREKAQAFVDGMREDLRTQYRVVPV